MLTEERKTELNKLAKDIVTNLVFCSWFLKEGEEDMIQSIFMPLGLMGKKDLEKLPEDISMIYEYLDKAGPRSINGFPCFLSFSYLSKEEAEYCRGRCIKIQQALKEVEE